jgi:hypothetical protein
VGPGYKHTWKKEPSFSSTAFARLVARVEGLAVPFDTTTLATPVAPDGPAGGWVVREGVWEKRVRADPGGRERPRLGECGVTHDTAELAGRIDWTLGATERSRFQGPL